MGFTLGHWSLSLLNSESPNNYGILATGKQQTIQPGNEQFHIEHSVHSVPEELEQIGKSHDRVIRAGLSFLY